MPDRFIDKPESRGEPPAIVARLSLTPNQARARRQGYTAATPMVYPWEVFERQGGSLDPEDVCQAEPCEMCGECPAPRLIFLRNKQYDPYAENALLRQQFLKGYFRGLCACERKAKAARKGATDDEHFKEARVKVLLKSCYRALHPIATYEQLAANTPEDFVHDTLPLKTAWRRMERFVKGPNGFVIVDGPFASGKTLFISIILRLLVEQGYSCVYTRANELYAKYKTATKEEQIKFLEKLRTTQCLVIDDFHALAVAGTGYIESEVSTFYDSFLESRYAAKRATILGTNLKMDDQLVALTPYLSGHLRSRINGNKMIISLETRDQRVASGNWEPRKIIPFARERKRTE